MRSPLYFATALIAAGSLSAQMGTFTTGGYGCPMGTAACDAIYELMATGAWDLDGNSFQFLPAGSSYIVTPGGSYIMPSGSATPLNNAGGSSDDYVSGPHMLPFSFAYPGGAGMTNMIDVNSNGYVYLESGTISSSRCCSGSSGLSGFLADTPSIAVLGTDLNPNNGGTWTFEVQGTAPSRVALITWDGVPEFSATGANTVQCQLHETGNEIVICHVATNGAASTHSALVGYSPGGGTLDCGSIDFSGLLPSGAHIGGTPVSPTLSASGVLGIGTTITISVENLSPMTSAVDLQFAGGGLTPPIPLSAIGAPVGCDLQVDPIFFSGGMVVNAPTADLSFNVPNDPMSVGTTVQLQAFCADLSQVGSYAIPVFTSNVGTLTIGQGFNDTPATATPVTDGLIAGTNVGATSSNTGLGGCALGGVANFGNDVWYLYAPSCAMAGTATASFCQGGGSATFDTVITVATGTPGALVEVACNDDFCALQSEVSWPTTPGTVYYIGVGEWGANNSGTFNLYLNCQ